MLNNPTTISPRPMANLNCVMRDLDMDSDRVRALLDEGRLIGFNIAVKKFRPDGSARSDQER